MCGEFRHINEGNITVEPLTAGHKGKRILQTISRKSVDCGGHHHDEMRDRMTVTSKYRDITLYRSEAGAHSQLDILEKT